MNKKLDILRARFFTSEADYRPIVGPIKHPYWCTGYASNGDPVLVAYVDTETQLREQWPEAYGITVEPADHYAFSSRFPKPDWFNEESAP